MSSLPRVRSRFPALFACLICLVFLGAACGSDDAPASDDPSTSDAVTSSSDTAADPIETNDQATVSGEALTPFNAEQADASLGQPAPAFSTVGPDGEVVASPDGPTILAFLVHWCPHCQVELPAMKQWIDAGNLPDGVDVVAVSSGFDPGRGNWPPSAWFADEGWTQPIAVDTPGSTIAQNYGMTSFPYLVAIDADGNVAGRGVGGGEAQLAEFAALALGAS